MKLKNLVTEEKLAGKLLKAYVDAGVDLHKALMKSKEQSRLIKLVGDKKIEEEVFEFEKKIHEAKYALGFLISYLERNKQ